MGAKMMSTNVSKKLLFFLIWEVAGGGLGEHFWVQNRSEICKKPSWMPICAPMVLQRQAGTAQELQNGALSLKKPLKTCNKSMKHVQDFYSAF